MINFIEAQDEAKQLSRNLRRDVEVKPVDCDCDYSKLCYRCAGNGVYYELVFSFCGHPVAGDDRCEECFENFCAEREQVKNERLPLEHPQLVSLREASREESEAA